MRALVTFRKLIVASCAFSTFLNTFVYEQDNYFQSFQLTFVRLCKTGVKLIKCQEKIAHGIKNNRVHPFLITEYSQKDSPNNIADTNYGVN